MVMKNKTKLIIISILMAIGLIIFEIGCSSSPKKVTSESLYSVYSKDVNWIYLDATITEIDRDERTSLLKLINFTQESGMEGRFLFCYILSLAQQRGFRYIVWSEPLNDLMLVVFLESQKESLKIILGNRLNKYSFYEVIDAQAEPWVMLQNACGF